MPKVPISVELPDGLDPAKREQAERILAQIAAIREDNPLALYQPHEKQRVYHGARTPIKAFLGGNQSGKTIGGLADDLIQAVDRDCLPAHLLPYKRFEPPFHCRIVTGDFTTTMEGVVFVKLRELVPKSQLRGGGWDSAYDKQLRKLHFENGSTFDFLTYEQDLDKFGGVSIHRVHFDEEPPGEKGRQIYLQARARVMARQGDICFTMTPEFGMSWMFDEVVERADDDDVTVVYVATDDNTYLDPDAIEQTFARFSDEEQEYKRRGRMIAFGGLVAQVEDRHKVDSVSVQHVKGLPTTYCIIDPGAAQGAVLWLGVDKDDVLLCFDEHYPAGTPATLVENVAAVIREKNAYWGIEPYVLIDPSARNRTADGGAGVDAAYYALGIFPTHAQNDRFHSIMQLRRRVVADPPGLVISRQGCPKLLWELGRWRVAQDERDERAKRGNTGDTFATIGPDHLGDCLRYGCMESIWGPMDVDTVEEYSPGFNEAPPAAWINRDQPHNDLF